MKGLCHVLQPKTGASSLIPLSDYPIIGYYCLFSTNDFERSVDTYNFWQDFFDTYQSLSDWLKVLWLIVPPAFVLGLVALTLRFRLAGRRMNSGLDGELVYSIRRDAQNRIHILSHMPLGDGNPPLLLADPAGGDKAEHGREQHIA